MRLVDANKVMIVLSELKKVHEQIHVDTAIRAVAHTETVEAIPVSFIKEQIHKELTEEIRTQQEHGFIPKTNVSYAYDVLIERWKREQLAEKLKQERKEIYDDTSRDNN